ncbi:hypothetical protein [Salipiger sp.]|uniref:hypothetical protein n=1 Tax=Salipiger sp. TaxID=2078585 RepID=UPI003A968D2F
MRTFLTSILLAAAATQVQAATLIPDTSYVTPLVETFESAPLGEIYETDPIFAALGISGIIGIALESDSFDSRPGVGRSLGATTGNVLQIMDPGTFGTLISLSISFVSDLMRFGFSMSDQATTFTVDFLRNDTLVDSIDVDVLTADYFSFGFEADNAFDAVNIIGLNGAAIDSLTTDFASPVPLPAALSLLLAALGGVGMVGAAGRLRRTADQRRA